MSPKVLQRCSICGNFHASYLVEDKRLGKLKLCYNCWKARQEAQGKAVPAQPAAQPPDQAQGSKETALEKEKRAADGS